MKIHVLSVKLRDGQHDHICGQIEANGDQVVHSPHEADLIVTALKSAERITRHVPEVSVVSTVYSVRWMLIMNAAFSYIATGMQDWPY